MPKDSYTSILAEIREVVKQIFGLRKRGRQVREKIGKARDSAEIEKIRKQMGLK